MTNRKCPVCGNPLTGRVDRKYYSDQCRYLEKNKCDAECPILEINSRLRKNRAILKALSLCPIGAKPLCKEEMVAMGYDVTIFSSLFLTAKKQVYHLCYDYGFTPKGSREGSHNYQTGIQNTWDPWKFVNKNNEANTKSENV